MVSNQKSIHPPDNGWETHWILTSDMLPMIPDVRLRGGVGEVDGGEAGSAGRSTAELGFLDV
jgi:hypothetical protein